MGKHLEGVEENFHLRMLVLNPPGKNEQICPAVKSIPFKTNTGKCKMFLNKWKQGKNEQVCPVKSIRSQNQQKEILKTIFLSK